MLKELNNESFESEVLNSKGITVVDFWGEGCVPCKAMLEVLENLAETHKDVNFTKVKVDDNQELAFAMRVLSVPTVYIMKDGKAVNSFIGLQDKDTIENAIKEAM